MNNRIMRTVVPAAALLWSSAALAQTTVRGTVRSDQGGVITGASVSIPTLGVGATSRADGSYSFTIPAARATGQSARLVARFVGFSPESVTVNLTGGDITHDFTLKVNPLRLGEVVVTGAGTETTRERLGNVINTVDSTVLQRASEPQNVVSALAGKIPNVDIRTQSGEPGASASIKIRGATSVLGTNQPLFVVDGQPIDNTTVSTGYSGASTVTQNRASDINPNDIQSVDILMGSAAAAIYGARAANGVVLITTKHGTAGPTRYSLTSNTSFDKVDPNVPLQTMWGQGADSTDGKCTGTDCHASSLSWGPLLPAGTPTYNHVNEIYDTGTTFDNNLSVSGGNERTTFFLSGGSTNQNGVIIGPNNFYNRQTIRLKGTHQLFDQLEVGGNFNYANTNGRFVQKGSNVSGLLLGALRTPPDFNDAVYLDPISGLHRSYRFPNPSGASLTDSRGYDNPFFTVQNNGNTSELGRFIGNINLDYRPNDWLRIQETLGADDYTDSRREALPLTSSNGPDGAVERYEITNLEVDHNLLLTATRTFNTDFSGTLTLGQNLNSRRNRQVLVQGVTLNAPEPLTLQNTLSWTPSEFQSTRHIEGYFGEASANLYNQLYLTAGLRSDGFSTFGASQRRALFPKASAAWTFSNYFGWDRNSPINFGKLRVAYGETGREPPVYATISAFNSTTPFGSGYGDVINISQSGAGGLITDPSQGNSNLRPERSRELEGGMDLSFLGNRVDLGLTGYNKRSSDVILQVPVNAAQTGSTTALANGATISNRGLEVTLNTRPYTSENFAWEIGGNFGKNTNKVESLLGAEFVPYNVEGFTGSLGSSTVGYPVGVIRGSDFARCGRGLKIDIGGTVHDIDTECGSAPAGALYLGTDGLPVGDPTDRVIADPNPKWTAGLNSSIRIMNKVTLSGLLDIRHGGQVWDGTRGILYRFGTHKDTEILRTTQNGQFGVNFLTDVYPTTAGPGVNVVPFKSYVDWENWFLGDGGGFSSYQQQFIEDGSFVKLRELSAAFTLNNSFIRNRLGFESLDVRLSGRNLITWTNYRGLDPETNLGGAEWLTQGIDYFSSPTTRSFVLSFGLNK